jgi:TetR/AcrR family transcriptional repressor of nem operon
VGRPKEFDPDVAVADAMELFWTKGYGATTPADLVEGLGIGKGSLYNTFESKRALFERALRLYGEHRIDGLQAALAKPGPVKVRLQAALERIASPGHADGRRRGCLAVNTATELGESDEAAMTIVRGVFDRMEKLLQSVIEEGQQSGELAAEHDARELASLMLTTILGMTVVARSADRTGRARRVVRAAMALL